MKDVLSNAFKVSWKAAKDNFKPSLVLQGFLVVFIVFYLFHEPTQHILLIVADYKQRSGYWFSFVVFALAAGLLPEILRFVFFQRFRLRPYNLWELITSMMIWGSLGVLADFFYRCQTHWFGSGTDFPTVAIKVIIDQFIFSILVPTPLCIALFRLRDMRFSLEALRPFTTFSFYLTDILPVQVGGWCVWIPAVAVIYSMPTALQLPVASLIEAFWVLMFTSITETNKARFA